MTPASRRAVFLDRDGTLIEHVHRLMSPDEVKLIPGAGAALQSLHAAGFALVLVTNQSVVGRGLLSEAGLEEVHEELGRQLAEHGVRLDGYYFCPVVPKGSDRNRIEHHDRKPGPRMLLRAAKELDLDLPTSWMIGDMLSDVLAGRNAGCRGTILVTTGLGADAARGLGAVVPEGRGTHDPDGQGRHPATDFVAESLEEAAAIILSADPPDSA